MDKKNTMLLTVIAIATLLVAVVGATFAFFSISASSEGVKAANVTGSADSTGAITMTTETKNLYLKLSGADMDKTVAGDAGKTFFATTTATTAEMSHNYLEAQATATYDLAKFSLAAGNTKYDCTYAYTVTATVLGLTDANKADINAEGSELADDIKVVFTGADIEGSRTMTIGELLTAGTTGVPLNGTVSNLTSGTANDQTIKVYSSFENTTKNQDALSGINYTITITPDTTNAFSCTVVGE